MESVTTESGGTYEGVAAAWERGPAALYDKLAVLTVAAIADELRGAAVLDVGAGTGALCRALRAAGAVPTALDTSPEMLGRIGDAAECTVVGDMRALPFAGHQFDAAVSGFAISHIDDPEQALSEMRRVVRPRGRVIAAVFGEAAASASKEAVDEVVASFGYLPPNWYIRLKTRTEPRSNTPVLLRSCAERAGLVDVDVADVTVDSGLTTPESIAAYRLGLAHVAPFVASLSGSRRAELTQAAVAAVRECGQPVRPRVLTLSSRASA